MLDIMRQVIDILGQVDSMKEHSTKNNGCTEFGWYILKRKTQQVGCNHQC